MKGLVYYSMSFSFIVMLLIQNLRSVFARRGIPLSGTAPPGGMSARRPFSSELINQ